MFVLLLIILLINETLTSRKDDTIRYDILIINVTNALSDHFLTRCLTIIVSDNLASIENFRDFRIAKLLSMDYRFSRAAVVKTFSQYRDHIKFKYNKNRCARVLNIVLAYDELVKAELEKFPKQEQMQGPVWLFFLNSETNPVDYFRNVNIPFDIELITAKEDKGIVYFDESYRVSPKHPIRSQVFGNWTVGNGLKAPESLSPYSRRFDLEGIVLNGGFYDENLSTSTSSNRPTITEIDGYFGKVWKSLQDRLNFTTKFIPGDLYGGLDSQGKWNGLIGMAIRKEIDIIVAEMTMTKERIEVVDFLRPILITTHQVFFRLPGVLTEWDVVIRPFDKRTWVAFFISALLLSFSLKIVRIFETKTLGRANEFQFLQSLFLVISAITQQGNSLIPGSYSCRIIIFTMYFLSIILTAAYSGALTSFITVEKPQKPFDSLETMLKDGTYTLEQIPGTSGYTYFSEQLLQTVYQKLFSKLPPDQLPKNTMEAFNRVCEKKNIAVFGEYDIYELAARYYIKKGKCQISIMDRPVANIHLSLIIAKDSPYKGLFDYELTRMEYLGILKKMHDDTWGLEKRTLNPSSKFHAVSAEQVSKIYYLLLLGFMMSVFVVAVEIFHKKIRRT